MRFQGRQLQSTIDADGTLRLTLAERDAGEPGDDEIVVRIEAAPINPSDIGLLLGPADVSTLARLPGDAPGLSFRVPPARLPGLTARLGKAMPVGNEGAGTVVAAGRNASALMGRRVAMIGGGMYADFRRIRAADVVPLPDGTKAADGAALFVNPLTALGFVETARRDGHRAIVHTAAASNLGLMLQKICLADGIPLVNVVRSAAQAEALKAVGASLVVNSKDPDFAARLHDALAETGATVVFDAIGGGTLASDILAAMERVAVSKMTHYNRYGSDVMKQLYVYGALDTAPVQLNRLTFGFQWSAAGWLLFPFLQKAGADVTARLRKRVLDEMTTTFASRYTRVIGLAEALDPAVLKAYERKATGEKVLVDPTRG